MLFRPVIFEFLNIFFMVANNEEESAHEDVICAMAE